MENTISKGISFRPEVLEEIESQLEYGDTRSELVNDSLEMSLVIEDVMSAADWWDDLHIREKRSTVRQAMIAELRRQSDL